MISTHPLHRPGRKWLLPVIASIILFCFSAEAAAAESDINGYLLGDIGLTYGEIKEKYGEEADLSGFEGELFAKFDHNTYSFRPGDIYDAAYSGEGPFDVIPKDGAVCYAIDTTAGALFPWLDGSCTVPELAARGFSASAASSRKAAFAGEIEGAYCKIITLKVKISYPCSRTLCKRTSTRNLRRGGSYTAASAGVRTWTVRSPS